MGNPFEAVDNLKDLQDIHGALGKAASSGKLNPDQLTSVNNAMSLAQQSLQTRTAASRQLSPSFSGLRPTPLGNSGASGLWSSATGEVIPVQPKPAKSVNDRLPLVEHADDPTDILGNLRALAKNTFDDLATGRGVMMQAAGQVGADVMEEQVRHPSIMGGHGYIKSPKANPTPEAIASARAVGDFLGGTAVDPVVYGLGGLAEFGAAAKPLITAGFTGLGAYGTVQAAKQYGEAAERGDRAGKAAAATNVVLNSIMTGLGAIGTVHELGEARGIKAGNALFESRSSDLMDKAREHAVSQGGSYTPESLQQALGIPYPRALRVAQSLRNDPTTLLDPEGRTVKTEQQVAQTRSGAEPAKIYLARHGTTNFTGEGDADVADGWMESQLTDKGKQEGIQLGRKLRGEGITKVYTSSMQRAKETGYLASSELGVPMETNDNLRPWNLGELQGKTVGEVGDQIKYYQEHPDLTVPGGEPYSAFQQRWQTAFADLTTRAKAGERPLVVTHGRNLEAVSGFLSGKKGEIFRSDDVPKNGEVFAFFDSGQGFKSNTVKGNTDTNVAQLKAKYNIPDVKDVYSGEGERPPISSSDLLASAARFEAAEKAYKEGLTDAFSPKTPAQTTPAEKPVGTGEAAKENSTSEQASKSEGITSNEKVFIHEGKSQREMLQDAIAQTSDKYSLSALRNRYYNATERMAGKSDRALRGEMTRSLNAAKAAFMKLNPEASYEDFSNWMSEGNPLRKGPGAKTAGEPDIPLRPAEALTESMRGTPSGDKPSISERIATTLDGRYNSLRDFSDKLGRYLKDAPGKLWEKYKQPGYFPPGLKGYGRALGEWHFELTQAAADRRAMLSEMLRVVPDANRRAALSHYIQADGDATTLAKWHGEMADIGHKSTPDYERAMNLTGDEQHLARNIRGYFDSQFDEAHKAGMLEHGLQNYFPQMWKPRDAEEMGGRISAAMSHDKLRTNPGFIRQRFYENMFEGEKAGLKPISKDAGFLLGAYDRSMSQAIAARGFIRDLTNLRMADGRMGAWISGVGRKVENFTTEGERAGNTYLINPNAHPSMTISKDDPLYARRIQDGWEPEEARKVDISDYKGAASRNFGGLNHPSLRDWKWSTKTPEGENVFHQGDLVVHPEIADHLNNILKTSFLRSSKLGSMALKVSSTLKQSLLIGPFHQVQEGTHGIWHEGVNPFHPADIDLNDPLQAHAVRNGLVLDDADNLHQFMEGVQGGGIWGKIPGIGEGLDKYNNYLFHDYIPRLKMNLFKEAYARNLERYGKKWGSDEIAQLTAKQANAAFGGLNYKFMGRSQGMQDALRLGVLAPDFLEARARFMGQAFRLEGTEQRNAMLIRATMMQYGAARIMNYMLDGDFHWDRPFSVIHKGQEYTMRSVPGDFYHMVSDPQSFVYHRLNPVTGRTVLEAVTGRDEYGRPKDFKHQVADFFKIGVPIPFEGLVNPRDNQTRLESFLDTAMGSAGIARFKYMSNAERLTFKLSNDFARNMLPEDREKYKRLEDLSNQLSSGDISEDAILKEASAGTLAPNDLREISTLQNSTPLQRKLSHSINAEQALDIWKAATPAEKRDLLPIMAKKAGSIYGRYTGKKLTELEQKYDTILNTPVPEPDAK